MSQRFYNTCLICDFPNIIPLKGYEKLCSSFEQNYILGLLKNTANSCLSLFGVGDNTKATFIKP